VDPWRSMLVYTSSYSSSSTPAGMTVSGLTAVRRQEVVFRIAAAAARMCSAPYVELGHSAVMCASTTHSHSLHRREFPGPVYSWRILTAKPHRLQLYGPVGRVDTCQDIQWQYNVAAA
jgi:hypothetical protein